MKSFVCKVLLLLVICSATWSRADDIDLFVSPNVSAVDAPNVLIVLDNTANWSSAFDNEKWALVNVFNGLPLDKFNIGLMMFGAPDSGFVKAAIRPMDETNRPIYSNMVNGLLNQNQNQGGDRASGRTLARTMSEAHRYLSGLSSVGGASFQQRDYTGNTTGTVTSNAVYALPGNALSSESAITYNSPINTESCSGGTYIIYIGNTTPGGNVVKDNASNNNDAGEELELAGGNTTQIPLVFASHQDNYADEWARFLKADMGVVTYTVDIDPTPMPGGQNNGMGNSALLESIAKVSGGKYFRVDSAAGGGSEIADALNTIFSEIQSVNSVFASVSLPVSVNSQGNYLNQVYVGMFRPDQNASPRWLGNLKQYKLGLIGNDLRLLDADDTSAINSSTGFITECARSFWTPSSLDNYWAFSPRGECLAVAGSNASNYPDGNVVEKGGQAYRLRNDGRTAYTCSKAFGTCTSLTTFGTANADIDQGTLGVADATARSELISWAQGQDIKEDENVNGSFADTRSSVHGDVVHSRPVAINYGTDESPQVVVFYGGNDGMLRAVNGNRTASMGSFSAGRELWSFMPPEFFGYIKRLYDNAPAISFPGGTGGAPKSYGMDGAVTAYQEESTAWIFSTMRRGGRALYAFDVGTADSPALKWKKGCPNNFPTSGSVSDTDCTSGFTGIGQTWSAPKVFKAAGYEAGDSPMLIMGGGYDTCEDADPNSCSSSTKGNKVYVLDADSGDLLRTFDTDRSVIAEILVVPDSNGLGIYAYAADLGGNVYRISMGAAAPAAWTISKIASLGCDTVSSCTANRKFMFAPDAVLDGSDYILLLGSGDREKPLSSFTNAAGVSNYFFMLRDRPSDAGWLTSEVPNCGGAVMCLNSLLPITDSDTPSESDLAPKKGWYLGLSAGEQVVTSAITVFGTVTFSTHQPAPTVLPPGVCSSLGEARVYNIDYLNAEGSNGLRYEDLAGDGLPPSPVAGMVTLDDGRTVPFVIGANPNSPLEGSPPTPQLSVQQPTARVYWNIEN